MFALKRGVLNLLMSQSARVCGELLVAVLALEYGWVFVPFMSHAAVVGRERSIAVIAFKGRVPVCDMLLEGLVGIEKPCRTCRKHGRHAWSHYASKGSLE